MLDEPTSGLDPLMERVFQTCIAELHAAERTVLLSSHILGQVDKLSDSVTIIRAGRTVQQGTLAELRHLHRLHLRARFAGGAASPANLAALPGVHSMTQGEGSVTFTLDREHLADTLAWLSAHGVSELESQPVPLEDLFMREYAAD